MNQSPNQRRRSSIKIDSPQKNPHDMFPSNKSKQIQWESKVAVGEEKVLTELHDIPEHGKEKYKAADTHYQDIVK